MYLCLEPTPAFCCSSTSLTSAAVAAACAATLAACFSACAACAAASLSSSCCLASTLAWSRLCCAAGDSASAVFERVFTPTFSAPEPKNSSTLVSSSPAAGAGVFGALRLGWRHPLLLPRRPRVVDLVVDFLQLLVAGIRARAVVHVVREVLLLQTVVALAERRLHDGLGLRR